MDIHFTTNNTDFIWNDRKVASNKSKHGISFEQATASTLTRCLNWLMPAQTKKRVMP